ncbi:hypothetical protein HAX54_018659 [Datura stramonium]|uniref:Uncharacterized protein n=1 Tax=Datura stramonium TaxID=4076 RepID=A0ABS8Y4T6_DATST|nr:hypothetical protein [Datura stramonium]
MPPKFQLTRGGSQRKTNKIETTHQLRDENTDSEEEVHEIEAEGPTPAYQTRSIARQHVTALQSDEEDVSSEKESSSEGVGSDLEEHSGNEDTSSLTGDSEPLRGDVLKAKMSRFPRQFYGLKWISEAPGLYYPNMVHEFYVNYMEEIMLLERTG